MSTRIYVAYELRRGHDLWDVMMDVRRRATSNVRGVLKKVYRELVNGDLSSLTHDGMYDVPADFATPANYRDASRSLLQRYVAQIGSLQRNAFDLSVNVAIRRASARRMLLIPYAGSGLFQRTLDFMKGHSALADFHYQNATDRPKDVTARAWQFRASTWRPIISGRWFDKLVLEVVSPDHLWTEVCPEFELRQEMRKHA